MYIQAHYTRPFQWYQITEILYCNSIGLSEFFYISGNGHIFTHNEDNWKSLLEGYGLVHIDWKPKTKTDVIFVETYKTSSPCPLGTPECYDQPRIFIQTEQKIIWDYQKFCHASPNCIILEFSDFNRNNANNDVEKNMGNSIVLLPVMTATPSRISQYLPESPKVIQERNIDMVFFGEISNRRTGMLKAAEEHRKAHPNSQVVVAKVHKVGVVVSNYQEAKTCLLMHSFKDNCGGEYHRWSEFGAYGCIPVMEQFADTVGIHAYERCGGAVFTNRTHVIQTAASIVEKIDKGLYNNRSQEIVNWWKRGIQWDTILPTVYQVPS